MTTSSGRGIGLPSEVADFLDQLDEHHLSELPPRRREELREIQRRRNAGVLTTPVGYSRVERAKVRTDDVRARLLASAESVIRGYGLFLLAALLTVLAAGDIARPLGLGVAAVAVLYLEYRIDPGSGGARDEHVRRHR